MTDEPREGWLQLLAALYIQKEDYKAAAPIFEELVTRVGLDSKCASIRTTRLSVLDLEKDPGITLRILTEAARTAIAEDGAEVIILGCAGMAGYAKELEKELGVPVLDPNTVALKVAEMMVDLQLKPSAIALYAPPPQLCCWDA